MCKGLTEIIYSSDFNVYWLIFPSWLCKPRDMNVKYIYGGLALLCCSCRYRRNGEHESKYKFPLSYIYMGYKEKTKLCCAMSRM